MAEEVKINISAAADVSGIEKMRDELKRLRAEQRGFDQAGAPQAAANVGRRRFRLERNIDREGARMLRVEDY